MLLRISIAAAALCMAALGSSVVPTAIAQDAHAGMRRAPVYPPIGSAESDISVALAAARREHKRVILDFGGDWCPDCQVLNIYFNQAPNDELVTRNYIRVNINVGRLDANRNIASRYGVPLKAVPALAVLDDTGKSVYAQDKEFSDMRHLDASALTAFLTKWKP